MISFWIHHSSCLLYPLYNPNGTVNLLNIAWFEFDHVVNEPNDIKIGMDFLDKGFKI